MTREQNIRAILETNFTGFKDEIIDVAVENIMSLSDEQGEWIEWKGRFQGVIICSNCNTGFPIFAKDYNFCPNCGADMRGDK